MKWHVEILATANGSNFVCHFFVRGKNHQEASREARKRFVEEYYEQRTGEFVRVQLVELDEGILTL